MTATAGDYKKAVDEVEGAHGNYGCLNGDILRCFNVPCFQSKWTDYNTPYSSSLDQLQFVLKAKYDPVEKLHDMIVLFKPRRIEDGSGFDLDVSIIEGNLEAIEAQGYSKELDEALRQSIANFHDDIGSILAEVKQIEDEYAERIAGIVESSSLLMQGSLLLKGYSTLCLEDRCGILGHGNPASNIVDGNRKFRPACETVSKASPVMYAFLDNTWKAVTDVESGIKNLLNSDPAHHTGDAKKKLDDIVAKWQVLEKTIES